MSSTTVAQHTTQPLNFGPEWLRALSTPDATTPIPSSGGSSSGNIFKFSATKYRYSKDQILALRANVTERLAEDVRNEILENLRDVESVYRPNIIEPLALTAPNSEETAKMNSLSSYISGRTPGGGGRGGHTSQQSQQPQESRARGGSAISNGRGGAGARGRGGRETNFGPSRGNNNGDEHGENGAGGDEGSSSWSRGGGFPSRGGGNTGGGGGGPFATRVRSYDDREQSQSFRRGGGGGGTRQTAEAWRRSRGDEDENNDQNEDSVPATGSASWTSRGSATRRGGGAGPMENRTKSNDKWNYNDDRPGPSNSYESNQSRGTGGWRTNSNMSDRDQNSRRPQAKRDRMPEWMDDNNEGDNPISSATFEHGTYTGSSATRSNTNNSNEQQKLQTQSSSEDAAPQPAQTVSAKPQEEVKPEKSTPPRTDTAVNNAPTASETNASKPAPSVQQKLQQHSMPACDDDFEPSDVATTVVEATLADDHDYSPPVSSHSTPHPMSMEPTAATAPIIPQPQRLQSAPPPAASVIDDKQWFYRDPQNIVQGPFSSADMERWFAAGYFTILLPVKRLGEIQFSTIQQLIKELGRLPFRSDGPSHSSAAPVVQPQQPIVSEAQKFNPMAYSATAAGNSAYLEEYMMQQQQQRQNIPNSMLFNRQTSVPSSSNDRKPGAPSSMAPSQMQSYFSSQQQLSSSLFPTNLGNDPAAAYQQQQQAPQLQRSISATNQQQPASAGMFDEMQRSFRQVATSSNPSMLFGSGMSMLQSQQPDDIMTRLAQAMQSHGQQQQDRVEEQRRLEQQRRELELDRLKLAQQAEQLRQQREEDERRRAELQQQKKLEEELRKKQEASLKTQMLLEQMKEMTKTMDQRKTQQQPPAPTPKTELDSFLAFQQSVQFQKEQQAKIEAQKADNVRRYQEQLRQQSHPSPPVQPQSTFKLPDAANWARHSSQSNEQSAQPLNFAEIQKQEQEQERRAREAAMSAQHLAKSDAMNIPSSSSSSNKAGSWARTLFAGGAVPGSSHLSSSEQEAMESTMPESPISSFNQQATNAPKSRPTSQQQSVPWNTANTTPNTSLQDIQRQQSQNEVKQQQLLQQQLQSQQQHQAQSMASAHSSSSTPAWGGIFSQSSATPQTSSSSSMFWGDSPNPSSSTSKPSTSSNAKASTPWSELKAVATSTSSSSAKSHSAHGELSKSEREAKHLFNTTRTQDALSKWTQTQFKDNLQAIDVPTLVQLLKDIESAEEIVEYVQPYIGSVTKAKEFAHDFIVKRKQLASVEPELDNERLNALAMAPTSSGSNSGTAGDEGFQLASSNGQKKKAKKMKGQKIDVKQLGFMVNNRPEHRDDIDRVM